MYTVHLKKIRTGSGSAAKMITIADAVNRRRARRKATALHKAWLVVLRTVRKREQIERDKLRYNGSWLQRPSHRLIKLAGVGIFLDEAASIPLKVFDDLAN